MVSGTLVQRVKGRKIIKPVVYGSLSYFMGEKTPEEHTHSWKVYLKPYFDEDMSVYVEKVQFKLHESYMDNVRDVYSPPYEITETGWGEFEIIITVHFRGGVEKPLNIFHFIRLFQPNCTTSSSVNKPLVSENYDEIIFVDPPKVLCDLLDSMLEHSKLLQHHTNWAEVIEKYTAKVMESTEMVDTEIAETITMLKEVKGKRSHLDRLLKQRNKNMMNENTKNTKFIQSLESSKKKNSINKVQKNSKSDNTDMGIIRRKKLTKFRDPKEVLFKNPEVTIFDNETTMENKITVSEKIDEFEVSMENPSASNKALNINPENHYLELINDEEKETNHAFFND